MSATPSKVVAITEPAAESERRRPGCSPSVAHRSSSARAAPTNLSDSRMISVKPVARPSSAGLMSRGSTMPAGSSPTPSTSSGSSTFW